MKMPDNVKDLVKILLKNDVITVKELAMLNANKKEDRDELIELVQRIYNNKANVCDGCTVILMNEEDVLALLDYITDEPVQHISLSPITIPQSPVIEPTPYNHPYRPYPGLDIVYCSTTA